MVLLGQLFIFDGLTVLRTAVSADGIVLKAAHFFDAAGHGVDAFFVDAASDHVSQLPAFAFHITAQQKPAPCHGVDQHFAKQPDRILCNRFPFREPGVLRIGGEQPDALDFADSSHDRVNRGTVQLIEAVADLFNIPVMGRSAAEHIRNQRIHRRCFTLQLSK